jgi:hypothetical protein
VDPIHEEIAWDEWGFMNYHTGQDPDIKWWAMRSAKPLNPNAVEYDDGPSTCRGAWYTAEGRGVLNIVALKPRGQILPGFADRVRHEWAHLAERVCGIVPTKRGSGPDALCSHLAWQWGKKRPSPDTLVAFRSPATLAAYVGGALDDALEAEQRMGKRFLRDVLETR